MTTGWTPAGRADLDVLCLELVDRIYAHRPGCERCQAGYPACPRVTAAIQAVVDWRDLRALLTRAERLRAGQDLLDFGAALGFGAEQVRGLQAKWRAEAAA